MTSLERADWNIEISWVKVHVGIVGNELGDRLAKAAACDSAAKIVFNRIPMNTLICKIKHETKLQWQKEWKECTKAGITKEFFFSKDKYKYYPYLHSDGDKPRKNQGISLPF